MTPTTQKRKPRPSYAAERVRPEVRRRAGAEATARTHQMVGGAAAGAGGVAAGAGGLAAEAVRSTVGGGTVRDVSARRGFDRAMTAAAGRRVPYDRPLHRRVVVTRILLGVAVVLLLVVVFSPLGRLISSFVGDQVARAVPGLYRVVEADAAVPTPGSVEGFNAFGAIDGFVDTAWSVPFTPDDAAVGAACSDEPPGETGTLEVSFSEPTRIDRVTILPGVNPDVEGSDDHGAPQTVDVVFLGDDPAAGPVGCQRMELDDDFTAQDQLVGGIPDVRTVRVHVRQAFPAATASSELVAITELAFGAR